MCDGLRQWLYGCIAVLVLTGIIAYGFLSAPKVIRLEQEMQVTAYKLQEAGYAKTVTVTLKGAYAEKPILTPVSSLLTGFSINTVI